MNNGYVIVPLVLTLVLIIGAAVFYYKINSKENFLGPAPSDFKDGSSIKVNVPLIMAAEHDGSIELRGYSTEPGVMIFGFRRNSPLEVDVSYWFNNGAEVFSAKFLREDILDFLRDWKPTVVDAPDGKTNNAGETHIAIKFDVGNIRDKMEEFLNERTVNRKSVSLKPIKELSILDGANALFVSRFSDNIVSAVIPYKTLQAMVSEWYKQVPVGEEQDILDRELMALLEQEMK